MKALAVSEDREFLAALSRAVGESAVGWQLECVQARMPVKWVGADVVFVDVRREGEAVLDALERGSGVSALALVVEQETPALLLRALRLGAREVLRGAASVPELAAACRRLATRVQVGAAHHARVSVFASCRGGSGATLIATNLGYALASCVGKRVLLIDLDLGFGDAALYLSEVRPKFSVMDVLREIGRVDVALLKGALLEVAPGFSVLAAPEEGVRPGEVSGAGVGALIEFVRGHFDQVLVDVGCVLDTTAVAALDAAEHVYPVMQLSLPQVRSGRRLLEVYRALGVGAEKVRPIFNRVSGGGCEVGLDDAQRLLGQGVFASVPNHYKSVGAAVNQGVPLMRFDAGSPVSRSLRSLAWRVAGETEPAARGVLSRWLGGLRLAGGVGDVAASKV